MEADILGELLSEAEGQVPVTAHVGFRELHELGSLPLGSCVRVRTGRRKK